jgi:CTP synthase (UTP-ammonia lyase)
MILDIAIVGDFNAAYPTHRAIEPALGHAAAALSVELRTRWVATTEVHGSALEGDGVWIAPGSPYRSFEGALTAIRAARTGNIPLTATCGGFQHVLIEFARNVLGFEDADSVEHGRPSSHYVVVPAKPEGENVTRPTLKGPAEVLIEPGSVAHRVLGRRIILGVYYCSYEANPLYVSQFHRAGLHLTGFSHDGVPRVAEIRNHPFFLATQFQPQLTSEPGNPSPIVSAFVDAAARHSGKEAVTASVE